MIVHRIVSSFDLLDSVLDALLSRRLDERVLRRHAISADVRALVDLIDFNPLVAYLAL